MLATGKGIRMALHESTVGILTKAARLFLILAGNEIRDLDFNKKENIGSHRSINFPLDNIPLFLLFIK
jgi:hypothetical protein